MTNITNLDNRGILQKPGNKSSRLVLQCMCLFRHEMFFTGLIFSRYQPQDRLRMTEERLALASLEHVVYIGTLKLKDDVAECLWYIDDLAIMNASDSIPFH
jgi:hypothetical protein